MLLLEELGLPQPTLCTLNPAIDFLLADGDVLDARDSTPGLVLRHGIHEQRRIPVLEVLEKRGNVHEKAARDIGRAQAPPEGSTPPAGEEASPDRAGHLRLVEGDMYADWDSRSVRPLKVDRVIAQESRSELPVENSAF